MHYQPTSDPSTISSLKAEWRKTLTAPQDGMWESLTGNAQHWEIRQGSELVGYACVDDEHRLLQFYLQPEFLAEGPAAFQQFIEEQKIKKALIGTNNPVCMSLAMHWQKSVLVDTYLFEDYLDKKPDPIDGVLRSAGEAELERLVDFYQTSMGAPADWLRSYTGDLLSKGEVFVLEQGAEILGACEVRKSAVQPEVADLGMVVSVNYRRKGLGTYLLGQAKRISREWDRKPICSCEKENAGSLKSILNNGFRSVHQMLVMEF
jgi:GNAT superfamily N-acetyltransferase